MTHEIQLGKHFTQTSALEERAGVGEPVDPYREDTAMTSLVSYPDRCTLWGAGSYRGNCDGRLFKDLVLRYRATRIADPMMGSGTTRDVIAGLNHRGLPPIRFWGGDIKRGFNLLRQELPGKFDFIWLHPPYWSIVRYSDDPDDLSTIDDYPTFLAALQVCLCRCLVALVPGGRLAVLVGDIRRGGVYTPLGRDVMNFDGVVGTLCSVIIKAQHRCRSDTRSYGRMPDVPIKHEYCVVFRKPSTTAPTRPAP